MSKPKSKFPRETLETFFFEKPLILYRFSDLKRKRFNSLTANDRHCCQNCIRCLPENSLRKNTFCWKLCCGNFSLGFWVIFPAFLAGNFGRFFKTAFLRVRCTLRKQFFKNSYFFEKYRVWAQKRQIFGSKHSPVLSIKQITCLKEKERKKNSGENHKFSILFWLWSNTFLMLW